MPPVSSSARRAEAAPSQSSAGWELLRALGAALLTPPPANRGVTEALGLPVPSGVDHTEAFVLSAPPHAAIHLGPEGKLGGEGLDRVAGFWRALGMVAPQDADHLGVLLMLYAELGEAEAAASEERGRAQLQRARMALLHEHVWSWAPGYLAAVIALDIAPVSAWAELTLQTLLVETTQIGPPDQLPLAIRAAPTGLQASDSFEELLDVMVTPVRSGLILTRRDLGQTAAALGVGYRHGERRYTLKAMLEQDKPATVRWLASHARSWSKQHRAAARGWPCDPSEWWSARAEATAAVLDVIADSASGVVDASA